MSRPARALAVALLGGWLATPALASNCAVDSTGLVPLIDLGPGTYQGFPGGLYPGGSNHRPPGHDAAGVAIARSLVPLDTLGQPDPTGGRFVLVSIGMSNATQEFSAFVPKAMAWPARHPRLLVIDGAVGGQSADRIATPTAAYWESVATRLRGRGSSPAQVQAVWIKEANAGPTGGFPASADTLRRNLAAIVRILRQKLPNVRLAYLTSRIYAGYATGVSTLNPEPYAYESGFAVKWLIESQMAGVDSVNFDPAQGPVEAPWLAWGPYLWADGMEGRSDGLVWPCSAFNTDGTHPAAAARQLVSDSLLAFFGHDETTTPWFVAPNALGAPTLPDGALALAATPNPARGPLTVTFRAPAGLRWRLEVLDPAGRRVRTLASDVGVAANRSLRWDGTDDARRALGPGAYWLVLRAGPTSRALRVVRIP